MRSFTAKSGTKKWNKLLSRVICRYLLFLTLRRCNSVLCLLVSKGKRLRKWDKYLEQPRLDSCTCYLSTHLALYVILQLFPQLRQFLVRRGNFFSSQSSPRVFFLFYFFFFFVLHLSFYYLNFLFYCLPDEFVPSCRLIIPIYSI